MRNRTWLSVSLTLGMFFVFCANVLAADLVTTLHKSFRDFNYPHEEKVVGMEVVTKTEHQEGGMKGAERERAGKAHDLLVSELGRRGWKEDALAIDDITAKKLEMILGHRIKVFVYQCEWPEHPHRGEDLRAFFAVPITKMEECLTYEKQLQESRRR